MRAMFESALTLSHAQFFKYGSRLRRGSRFANKE